MKLYIVSLILFFSTSNCQYNLKTVVEPNKNHDSAIVDDVQILENHLVVQYGKNIMLKFMA